MGGGVRVESQHFGGGGKWTGSLKSLSWMHSEFKAYPGDRTPYFKITWATETAQQQVKVLARHTC